ncbi:unnamed protein product [Boreogadus saida]
MNQIKFYKLQTLCQEDEIKLLKQCSDSRGTDQLYLRFTWRCVDGSHQVVHNRNSQNPPNRDIWCSLAERYKQVLFKRHFSSIQFNSAC